MTSSSGSRFGRLLAELVVVFLGVLIALAADAWWDGRVDAKRELEYLNALQEDMEVATENLDAAIQETKGWLEGSDAFLALVGSDQAVADTVTIPFNGSHPAIPTGTLDALLSTGDVNLIRDRDLRRKVISASASLRDALRQLVMWDEYALANMGEAFKAEARVTMGEGRSMLHLPTVAATRRDPELVGIYRIMQNAYKNELELFETLRAVVSQLLGAVAANLEQS